ncbi:MAG: DNA starvation/stationary phase protection protein Dps [Candidatus Promineifilaceae bacterium]|nr:DNA starvation/stationary phase protection protein Dps [Candidatus Promineifilaceae bacterium]
MTQPTNGGAKAKVGRLHETSIEMDADLRQQMIVLLNQQLANTADLYTQSKQAHWNVKGIHFEELHVLFDKVADAIFPYIDMIAERVTALGGTAKGTVRMAAESSQLPEMPLELTKGEDFLAALTERWAQYGGSVRAGSQQADEAGDLDTSDLLIEVSRTADKMLWFIEAHLQG